jgi:hypothetical protein
MPAEVETMAYALEEQGKLYLERVADIRGLFSVAPPPGTAWARPSKRPICTTGPGSARKRTSPGTWNWWPS